MFKSFNQFTKGVYQDLGEKMRKMYGSEAKHRVAYLGNNGFGDWLTSIKGTELTLQQTKSIVKTYVDLGDRKAGDIPYLLSSLEREYDITCPIHEGILTKEFWEKEINPESSPSI